MKKLIPALLLLTGCGQTLTLAERNGTDPYWRAKAMQSQWLVACTARDAKPSCAHARLDVTPRAAMPRPAPFGGY